MRKATISASSSVLKTVEWACFGPIGISQFPFTSRCLTKIRNTVARLTGIWRRWASCDPACPPVTCPMCQSALVSRGVRRECFTNTAGMVSTKVDCAQSGFLQRKRLVRSFSVTKTHRRANPSIHEHDNCGCWWSCLHKLDTEPLPLWNAL